MANVLPVVEIDWKGCVDFDSWLYSIQQISPGLGLSLRMPRTVSIATGSALLGRKYACRVQKSPLHLVWLFQAYGIKSGCWRVLWSVVDLTPTARYYKHLPDSKVFLTTLQLYRWLIPKNDTCHAKDLPCNGAWQKLPLQEICPRKVPPVSDRMYLSFISVHEGHAQVGAWGSLVFCGDQSKSLSFSNWDKHSCNRAEGMLLVRCRVTHIWIRFWILKAWKACNCDVCASRLLTHPKRFALRLLWE